MKIIISARYLISMHIIKIQLFKGFFNLIFIQRKFLIKMWSSNMPQGFSCFTGVTITLTEVLL